MKRFSIRRLLPIILLIILLSAYNRVSHERPQPSNFPLVSTTCKSSQYALEKVCIPPNPQRVVVLDYHQLLPTLLALGIKPVGAMTLWDAAYNAPFLEGMTVGINNLGSFTQAPNLEKILALHPDLILGWDHFPSSNKLLPKIAPTLIFPFTEVAPNWKQFLKLIAAEFEKKEVANKLLNDYELRVKRMRQTLERHHPSLRASCIMISSGAIYLVAQQTPVQSVFHDIGLQRSSLEDDSADWYPPISLEKLPDLDVDIIFVATSEKRDQYFVQKLKEKPLWQQVKAVQQNQVYSVDADAWTSFNILSANAILDDLEKYLIDKP
jgi:iron complex transport system substrate-binding protein